MSSRVCFVFAKLSVLSILVFTVGATGCSGGSGGTTKTTGGTTSTTGGSTSTSGGMAVTSAGATGSASGATGPGGAPSKGGATSIGGVMGTGSLGTGGAASTGGSSGSGGVAATGGTATSGLLLDGFFLIGTFMPPTFDFQKWHDRGVNTAVGEAYVDPATGLANGPLLQAWDKAAQAQGVRTYSGKEAQLVGAVVESDRSTVRHVLCDQEVDLRQSLRIDRPLVCPAPIGIGKEAAPRCPDVLPSSG